MSVGIETKKHITETKDFSKFKSDSLLRLNIACGNDKKEGFIGIDIAELDSVDVVHDLNSYSWPVEENSVYEIICLNFVEHVKDLKRFMEECHRIMMNQATLTIVAPYYTSIRATQDFTHIRVISEATFLYFTKEYIRLNKLEHYNIDCDFKIEHTRYYFNPEWVSRSEQAQDWARKHNNNVVTDIEIILRAIK